MQMFMLYLNGFIVRNVSRVLTPAWKARTVYGSRAQNCFEIAKSFEQRPFEAEARLSNIKELSPYRKENTTLHRRKLQPVNSV
jgi:hypothetical protein